MMSDVNRARLLYETARHLTASQIYSRARAMALRFFRRASKVEFDPPAEVPTARHEPLWRGSRAVAATAPEEIEEAIRISQGRFRFLNQEISYVASEPRWHDPEVTQLWRYHLHYFDYVRHLVIRAAAGEWEEAFATFRKLADSWMRSNERLVGDGWHPYTVSLRVVNWCHALDVFSAELARDPEFRDRFVRSLYGQTRFVARNLETDVRGNHLLKNLRAMIWGGIVFEGDEAGEWLDQALRMLEIEIAEQVHEDGGHFERTPGYHLLVLWDVIEIAEFLRRNRAAPRWLEEAQARMLDFLDAILPADGRLPLFKDTTLPEDGSPLELFTGEGARIRLIFGESRALAKREPRAESEFLSEYGYAVTRSARHHLVMDIGKPCPEYLPAHAHADMFSFELTIDGSPVVVDSGVYEYETGRWRDYFRSTRAHNTVEVAGMNQSEVWGSFRVGRRAMPRNVLVASRDGVTTIRGEHDGYTRLSPPVVHRRTIVSVEDFLWVVLDELLGSGRTTAANYLHLIREIPFAGAGGSISTQRGWYSRDFGKKEENTVLVLRTEGALPHRMVYALSTDPDVAVTMEDGMAIVSSRRRTLSIATSDQEPPSIR
jgi:uncharacterized heparinase superfamily protein